MKLASTILIWLFAFHFSAIGQTLPTQTEQYAFLSTYLKQSLKTELSDTLITINNEQDGLSDISAIIKDLNLSVVNRKYIKKQIVNNNKALRLDTNKLNLLPWKSPTNHTVATWVSLPIFFIDRKLAIIRKRYYCGPVCGQDGFHIYMKVKGRWKQSKFDPPQAEF